MTTTSADLTETTTIGHSLRPVPAPAACSGYAP